MNTFVFWLLFSSCCLAVDIVRMNQAKSVKDIQTRYKVEILQSALHFSKALYGPYQIITQGPATTIDRAILEVKKGTEINTFMAITTAEWEHKTLPIRIPIRRGLLKYRLLAINNDSIETFKNIKTLDALKKLKVGLRRGWATMNIMKAQGFNIVEANNYEGLFHMLSSGRIDYIPRGINEIYHELDTRKEKLPNLIVEQHLALAIPAPFYIFVSPSEPRLRERLKHGLEIMVKNRSLHDIFYKYYGDDIAKANISERNVIAIDNLYLHDKTPFNRKELWFENDKVTLN